MHDINYKTNKCELQQGLRMDLGLPSQRLAQFLNCSPAA